MRNIFLLITRYHVLFLFVILELFALRAIFNAHKYQEVKLLNTTNGITSTVVGWSNAVNTFLHLGSTNKDLVAENLLLKNQIKYQNIYTPADSSFPRYSTTYSYQYITAKVVNNTINKSINYITLDKGSKDGIAKGLGVISSNGVVGIITNVSENFSLAMSVLSVKSIISVKHKNSQTIGNLTWDGSNPFVLQVKNISKTIPVKKNDSIVTAGFSSMFPPDILVATIKNTAVNLSTGFYDLDVTLTNTINALNYVYIVKNSTKKEIDSLEINKLNE